ncbi:MAG TPA: carboxypeptidase-like regulatory domain-containing protein [Symbiobacteriaceae bacterium]|jgi:hypothetical protein
MRKMLSLMLGLLLVAALVAPAAALPAVPASGVVTDQMGRPIPAAELEVYKLGAGLVAVLTSGQSGAFHLLNSGEPGALWQFRVAAKGYRTLETGWMDLASHRYQTLKLEPLLGDLQIALQSDTGKALNGTAQVAGPGGQLLGTFPVSGGTFRQTGLLAGSYRVIVTAPGYGPQAATVEVAPERTANAVFTLNATGLALSGEVTDAVTSLGVAGATVEALRADGTLAAAGQAGAEGRFRLLLPGATPGAYRLQVTAAGYHMAVTQPATLAVGQEHDWSGDQAIALQPLAGTVYGSLLGPYGAPQIKARVVLQLKGYGEVAEATTDDDADFQFDRVAVGEGVLYRVSFRDSNFHVDSPWTELKPGRNEVLLQVQSEFGLTFGTGKLSGVVVTPAGAPVAGAKVELTRFATELKSVLTGDDGSFLLNDIPATARPGMAGAPYSVRITKDGYVASREFTVAGQPVADLTLPSQTRTSLRAVLTPASADLRGRVTDTDGRPATGAKVQVQADGGTATDVWATVTDGTGWYDLKDVPIRPAGRYLLRVETPNYLTPGARDITANVAGGTSLPTARLTPRTATFTGQVAGPDGVPLTGVKVSLRDPNGKLAAEATTDLAGLYRLNGVLAPGAGLLTLTAAKAGWTTALAEIAASPAPGTTLNRDLVILPNTGALEGRVLDESNQWRQGVQVDLLEESVGVVATAVTDIQGHYGFANVTLDGAGWFWLRVRTTDGVFAGSLSHQTELVPLLRLAPGETTVTDLLIRRP